MATWHVSWKEIDEEWTFSQLITMLRRLVERNEREAEAMQGARESQTESAPSSRGKTVTNRFTGSVWDLADSGIAPGRYPNLKSDRLAREARG